MTSKLTEDSTALHRETYCGAETELQSHDSGKERIALHFTTAFVKFASVPCIHGPGAPTVPSSPPANPAPSRNAEYSSSAALIASGAALSFLVQPLNLRNNISSTNASTVAVSPTELPPSAHQNLLSSPICAAALRLRYGTHADLSSMEWVRQRAIYTGVAMVANRSTDDTAPSAPTPSPASAGPPTASVPISSPPARDGGIGSHLLRSFLQPFLTPAEVQMSHDDEAVGTPSLPHGRGTMTYLLYGKARESVRAPLLQWVRGEPKQSPVPVDDGTAAGQTNTASPPQMGLDWAWIPSDVCPTLQELEPQLYRRAETEASSSIALSSSQPQPPHLFALVVFEGKWKQGRRHGHGRLTVYGRFVLECRWFNDIPCVTPSRGVSQGHNILPPPPVLRTIARHIPSPAAAGGKWCISTQDVYMGDIAFTTAAEELKKQQKSDASWSPLPLLAIPQQSSEPASPTAADTANVDGSAFAGLTWADHVVPLPHGFGEARLRELPMGPNGAPKGPLRWLPRLSAQPPLRGRGGTALPWRRGGNAEQRPYQYCGQWVAGAPEGFGIEVEREVDITSRTAYPWQSAFIGQHRKGGYRYGPGTMHIGASPNGRGGSSSGAFVVSGTWVLPDTAGSADSSLHSANVVLLPPSARTHFTLQGVQWLSNQRAVFSTFDAKLSSASTVAATSVPPPPMFFDGGRSLSFKSANLTQSAIALSSMWEPLFSAMDDMLAGIPPVLSNHDQMEESALPPAAPSTPAESGEKDQRCHEWSQACRILENIVSTSECTSVLQLFQASMYFLYGFPHALQPLGEVPPPSLRQTSSSILEQLASAGSRGPFTSSVTNPTPIPSHSWCIYSSAPMEDDDVSIEPAEGAGTPSISQLPTWCPHAPLTPGVTHHTYGATTSSIAPFHSTSVGLISRLFSSAMQAVAAMVSSLRLRLLSCLAAHPDVCEMVMGREQEVVQYSWDMVFSCVAHLLHHLASAVAVHDIGLVGSALERQPEEEGREESAESLAGPSQSGAYRSNNTPIPLTEYLVAVKRCGGVLTHDFIASMQFTAGEQSGNVAALHQMIKYEGEADDVLDALRFILKPLPICRVPAPSPFLPKVAGVLAKLLCRVKNVSHASAEADGKGGDSRHSCETHRSELLLRHYLLAATQPTKEESSGSGSSGGAHPFALLLILSFMVTGRLTPSYPALASPLLRKDDGGNEMEVGETKDREGLGETNPLHRQQQLYRSLVDLFHASWHLTQCYSSVQYDTQLLMGQQPSSTTLVMCSLEDLAIRLEYVLSPCAAMDAYDSLADRNGNALMLNHIVTLRNDESTQANSSFVMQQDRIPNEMSRHLCGLFNLDGPSTWRLSRRLFHYWASLPPLRTQPPRSDEDVGSAAEGGDIHHSSGAKVAFPPSPSPFVLWVLTCLQACFAAPLSSDISAVGNGNGVFRWRKSISALLLQSSPWRHDGRGDPEASPLHGSESSRLGEQPADSHYSCDGNEVIFPPNDLLSRADSWYVLMLQTALNALFSATLTVSVRLVYEADDDEDVPMDHRMPPEAAMVGSGSLTSLRPEQVASPKPPVLFASTAQRPTTALKRRNIFMTSSEEDSSSPAEVYDSSSSASSPVDPCLDNTPASVPPLSNSVNQLLLPRDRKSHPQQRHTLTPFAARSRSRAAPALIGKEMELELKLPFSPSNDANSQRRHLYGSLTWEIVEATCTSLLCRLEAVGGQNRTPS